MRRELWVDSRIAAALRRLREPAYNGSVRWKREDDDRLGWEL